jgi:hypothetical protein
MVESIQGEARFWKKKEYISFALSILVFFIHISSFAQYGDSGHFISAINGKMAYFVSESITRFAVPMFFILSGIAFYKDYDNKKYFKKIKSRVFTLVIPYLLWNTLWMIFDIVCSYTFISRFFTGRKPFVLTFSSFMLGIFHNGNNGPFWFVFNLIIFSAAAPLIYLLIRNKYVGIVSVGIIAVLTYFDFGLPSSVFSTPISIVFYMIGAIIGKHFFALTTKKAGKGLGWGSVSFLVVYIVAKNIFPPAINTWTDDLFLKSVIFVLASFALWNAVDLFIDYIRPRAIYGRSFAIFAMHINISAIITKLIALCLPRTPWMAIPNFIITVILTLIVINVVCVLLERFLPHVNAVLMGNRRKKQP